MVNSKDGQDNKDKYFDTSRKILSQEMTMCNMEALISYFFHIFFFKNLSNVKVKILNNNRKILSQGKFMWNIKALTLTIQMLLTRLKYSKSRPDTNVKLQGQKSWFPWKGSVNKNTHVKCQSSSTHYSIVINKFKVLKK